MEFTIATLGVILIIAAIALVLIVLLSKKTLKGTFLSNPVMALGVAVVLACLGWYVGGVTEIQNYITPAAEYVPYVPTTPATGYGEATFTVTATVPAGMNNPGLTIASGSTEFALPFVARQAVTGVDRVNTSTNISWKQPWINFTITPVPWTGATADDLATIYFEVSDPEATVVTDDGDYHVFTLTSGERQIKWRQVGTETIQYESGSVSTLITTTTRLQLNMTFLHNASLVHVDDCWSTAISPSPITITFHNAANTWSKVYTMNVFCTDIYVGA